MPGLRRVRTEVAARRPVVWDPHPRGSAPVPGVRLATPNEAELAHQVPPEGSGRLADVARRAAPLPTTWEAPAVAVTLGADGALVVQGDGTPLGAPAPAGHAGAPCGAGDRAAAPA